MESSLGCKRSRPLEIVASLRKGLSSLTGCCSVQDLEAAEYDTWLNMERGPSPAYLWIRCNDRARDVNCHQTLKQAGIIGRPGPSFGSEVITSNKISYDIPNQQEHLASAFVHVLKLVLFQMPL